MSAATLTAIGGILVPLLVLGMVPVLLARQTRKRDAALEAKLEERAAEEAKLRKIREEAEREAQAAASDNVTMETLNRALAATVQDERAANRERLVELREQFTAEAERRKQLTDSDLDRVRAETDRVRAENGQLATQIRALEDRIAQLTSRAGP